MIAITPAECGGGRGTTLGTIINTLFSRASCVPFAGCRLPVSHTRV